MAATAAENTAGQPQRIILVRHGESKGQASRSSGILRTDPSLRDCGITRKGVIQARALIEELEDLNPDLVVCSPLKRAIQTALIAFPDADRLIMYPSLSEQGSKLPENQPRPLSQLTRDSDLACIPAFSTIDLSQMPTSWPEGHDPRRQNACSILPWLESRPEKTIVIVCHMNTILDLIRQSDLRKLHPRIENCRPIECVLSDSTLMTKQELATGGIPMDGPPAEIKSSPRDRRRRNKKNKN